MIRTIIFTYITLFLGCSFCSFGKEMISDKKSLPIRLNIKNDSIFLENNDIAEKIVHDYYRKVGELDSLSQVESLSLFIASVNSEDMFRRFISLTELYLYDAFSPVRNEKLYLLCIDLFSRSKYIKSVDKAKYKEQQSIILENNVGSVANDLFFDSEKFSSLYLTGNDQTYKLLFFYETDCPDCSNAIDWLRCNDIISRKQEEGKLIILAITDNQQKKKSLPESWIKCCAPNYDESYHIQAIPSIYLLSPQNKVIFKDVTNIEDLITFLKTI